MEAKKPRSLQPSEIKKSMDDLFSKFAAGLQKPTETGDVPPMTARAAADSSKMISRSVPSTSSGFVNDAVAVNGVEKTAASVQMSDLIEESKGRRCVLCNTKNVLADEQFISHILGKKHSIMESKQTRTKLQKEERDRRTLFVSGFPLTASPEEICKLFLNSGMIDFHWTKRHAFVEFSTRGEAVAVLKKRPEYHGKKLSVAPRTQRCHTDDDERESSMKTLLSPQMRSVIARSCGSVMQLSDLLEQLLRSIELHPDEYEKRHYIRDHVARCLRPTFPVVTCSIFGSSANNLGFSGADLDLYAHLGYDPYNTPRQAEGEAEAARLVTFLAKTFRRERGVSNVVAIPRARVPIVKFCLLGVSVDLSFRNAMPIQNTALIKLFTSVHPCVRPYMMLVRFWAKTQNIAGGGKPATLLTNYALTMLMAFVLMNKQQILPPVAQLRNNQYRNVIINGWNCGFSDVIPYAYRQTRKYSIFELALNFFDYYANLDASQWVICPLLGRLVSKEDMNSKSMKRLPMLEDYCRVSGNIQLDTSLCVQDPFDLIHNITRGLTRIPLERFQLLCRRSSVILQKIMDLQLPLEALFEPIELSDDSFSDIDGSEHRPRSQNEDGEPEVIDVDEETSDLSQDVEILTNDTQRPPSEPELIDLDDDDSSHGIKRSLTDDSGVGDVSTTMNISTNSVVSLDRKTFLSQLDLNSPYLYKFQVPSDKIVEVNVNTGALSYKEGQPRAEDVRWSGLNILKFVLHNIFATGVISRVTEGESPNKKMKEDPNLDTVHCFAILLVTFKHNLSESREVLMNLSPSYSSSTDSPFTFEKSLTDRLLKNMPKNSSHCSTSIFPFTVQFFVCYRPCEAYELLLVANASILSESVKAQVKSFLQEFRQMTEQCMQRALQCLDQTKPVL